MLQLFLYGQIKQNRPNECMTPVQDGRYIRLGFPPLCILSLIHMHQTFQGGIHHIMFRFSNPALLKASLTLILILSLTHVR